MEKNKKGFTLIELLVVVLIIGIIAAVALPQYKMAVAKSRYSTIMNLAKSIALAQDRYFMVHGAYANRFVDLDIDMPADYISNSKENEYCYNWGGCKITMTGALYCYERTHKNTLNIYFHHSIAFNTFAGKFFCGAQGTNENNFSNKLCKQITNNANIDRNHDYTVCDQKFNGNSYLFSSY